MSEAIQSLRGMNDILPPHSSRRARLLQIIRQLLQQFGYLPAELPLLEKTQLFKRTIGGETDIVSKEMYSFDDRNQESITLRPEATAGAVRAMIENGRLQQITRLFVEGPMFRYEKPQEGRSRQFTQVSVECFGLANPSLDAELIAIGHELFTQLDIREVVSLEINSIGLAAERKAYQAALVQFLSAHIEDLDEDSKRRLQTNPLRILDSKDAKTQEILNQAPLLHDYLGEESKAHFAQVCGILEKLGIAYHINPRLVRGLDYYCHTVFEWTTRELGAQGTICAGGRYDGLVEQLGGKATPAAGFAFGIERIFMLWENMHPIDMSYPDIYILATGIEEQAEAMRWAMEIRRARPDWQIIVHHQLQALKKQFAKADAAQARFVLVFGSEEVQQGLATLKNLATGEQQQLDLAAVIAMNIEE
ncbi:histidine--tRNA ligase [Suttonella indologenes]|uniref:Histidine--tRNA ligase n=1 Tax=Suttonella indologenes TaxID=13276 RepID=A0A380N005_9GAMM|nr:histidine--tRNA ligase [Suttonella indologenes]SUO98140.1 Histidine--tRNA ligase [Suttonella indologenes]